MVREAGSRGRAAREMEVKGGDFPQITGYLHELSVRPGGELVCYASVLKKQDHEGMDDTVHVDVVRILCGDPSPEGPGLVYEDIDFQLQQRSFVGTHQPVDRGSYALIQDDPSIRLFARRASCVFAVTIQPWLLGPLLGEEGRDGEGRFRFKQVIASTTEWSLFIETRSGLLVFEYLSSRVELTHKQLESQKWYSVYAGFDTQRQKLTLGLIDIESASSFESETALYDVNKEGEGHASDGGRDDDDGAPPSPLVLAAEKKKEATVSTNHFNGRLEDPKLFANMHAMHRDAHLAFWDFSRSQDTQTVCDLGPYALSGRLVNVPNRAMRGSRWTGKTMDWQKAPLEYAAIHFHEDDIYDCRWTPSMRFTVPVGTLSACYGLRLRSGEYVDILPFYVLAPLGKPTSTLCFLAPTLTYVAYANHARGNCNDAMRERMCEWKCTPYNADDFPIFGRSTYNYHPDGTGISFSSRLRPTLTIRPAYITFTDPAGSGLRHFSADTHLLYWMHTHGIECDCVTDEDLDDEGIELLQRYECVLTGSHPEYHTPGMLDALQTYVDTGGKLMYMGGNGFYWRVARQATLLPGMIELRRAEGGIRAWSPYPGESYHQLDGGYGGLWRRNGRPPQKLAGVGFSSQGLFEGSFYRRTSASFEPSVAWIFDGVNEELLGNYGLSGGGAAGFELDRADHALGTPAGTIILAVSEQHQPSFIPVLEEMLSRWHTVTGENSADLIRAEIVYCDKGASGGGAFFSVGSITFCGSLLHNKGDNGVSKMIHNVIARFAPSSISRKQYK